MKKSNIFLLLLLIFVLITECKKKTTIKVKLINPLLNEYVSNATIALVERHINSRGSTTCKEIATAITNTNGECDFSNEKFRSSSGYDYYCAVKRSWDVDQGYPCEGKTSRFLKKGGSQDWLVGDYLDGSFKTQYNNLFNPAQIGDSLIVTPERLIFIDPTTGTPVGGGGVFGGCRYGYDPGEAPYQSVMLQNDADEISGVVVIKIRKRKMGVVTVKADTIKVYPNQLTIAQINW